MNQQKRILIIAYYWPPSGGSGVQRWLKFVKYLTQSGVIPYVFTPENPAFDVKDASLIKDVPEEAQVIKFPIWEPYEAFFKLSSLIGGQPKSVRPTEMVSGKKKSFFQTISTAVRGNFFIPDPRVFWVRPSVKFLETFLRDNKINTIITTGPPHSMHLIGYRLKKRNPSLRWLADFRDPWTEWGLLDSLMLSTLARKAHQKLEANVLKTADEVITVTPFFKKRFEFLSGRNVNLLTNGFDEDDFKNVSYTHGSRFLIRHIGIVNEKCDPRPFMKAVEALMAANENFKDSVTLEFIGEVHPQFKAFIEASVTLSSIVIFSGNMPHKELIKKYGESSLLLLILTGYKDAAGLIPGKLFEYMATGLPILGVGPAKSDVGDILDEAKAGVMLDTDDKERIIKALIHAFDEWRNSAGSVVKKTSGTERYSRRYITRQLIDLL